jgi:hypothetical protein
MHIRTANLINIYPPQYLGIFGEAFAKGKPQTS